MATGESHGMALCLEKSQQDGDPFGIRKGKFSASGKLKRY